MPTRLHVEPGGFVAFDRQPSNSRHRHDYWEVCLALSGEGRFLHGGVERTVGAGDVFVAEPGVVHEISSHDTRDLALWFLSFRAVPVPGRDETDEDRVMTAFLRRRRIVGRAGYDLARWLPLVRADVGPAAEAALRLLCVEMARCLTDAPTDALPPVPPEIAAAVAYIEANLDRPLPAGEVAERVGLSERALRRRFQAAFGQSVADEILERRMNRAAQRLLMGFPVSEVALGVGMDPGSFARTFRAVRGDAPKRFQSAYRPGGGTLGRTRAAGPVSSETDGGGPSRFGRRAADAGPPGP